MGARRVAIRIFVPVVTALATLLVVELLLRLPVFEGFKDYEPTLRGGPLAYVPNQVARHRLGNDFDTEIRINSRGFRDEEPDPVPAPKKAAVALGDSFTEGWGVQLEHSWAKQLQLLLRTDGSGYAQVYNAGRSGTNPKNYAAVYEKYFRDDPHVDLVVVGLCLGNDIIEESTPSERPVLKPSLASRFKFYALRHSVLYNLVRRSLRYNPRTEKLISKLGLTTPPEIGTDFLNADKNRRRWPYTAEFLTSFGSSVQADGRRFLIVLIPTKEQVIEGYIEQLIKHTGSRAEDVDLFGFRDHVLRHLRERQIDVLDLTPAFSKPETGTAADLYFRGDGHWNAAGHRLAAARIAEHLQQKSSADEPTPAAATDSAVQLTRSDEPEVSKR